MPECLPEDDRAKGLVFAHEREAKIIDTEVWLRSAFENDPRQACALLYRLYYAPLFSHALRFVHSTAAAEDIVAEIFCRFWADRLFERITTSYQAYLFQCVRHACYHYVKLEFGRKESIETCTLPETAWCTDDLLQFDELSQLLEKTIDGLPPQCKRFFILSRIDDRRHAEIAHELGISSKAVERHITKALRILRRKLNTHWNWF